KEYIESNVRLLLPSADMQKLGSAITYARRYALISMFALETADDDGNDAITPKKVSKKVGKNEKKGYNKTPTQALNERVVNAFEILEEAKKDGDIETAKKVYKQAKSEKLTQIQDRCINSFGDIFD
ncbi:MAG: ERF family protein, partial [Candidatus Thioglobus sp.]